MPPATKKKARLVGPRVTQVADPAQPTTGELIVDASQSGDELHKLIQEAAYFKARARDFTPGGELQDWLEAESEVVARAGQTPAAR
jgi:hypothetical protein